MNTLRLENINLHAPYKVLQDPERHNNFYFVSDSGARFDTACGNESSNIVETKKTRLTRLSSASNRYVSGATP